MTEPDELDDEGTLLLEQCFAIVPEWVLDAEISDAALRLYAGPAAQRPDLRSADAEPQAARHPSSRC